MSFRRILQIVLLFVCVTQLAGETVRVATLNVRNYLIMDRLVDGIWRRQYPKPEAEKTALRTIIRKVDPDVLAIQEMGDTRFLEELQRDLKREGIDFPHAVSLEADDTERHVVFLSKIPFTNIDRATDLTYKLFGKETTVRRGLLGVSFETEGEEWTVFNLHLKSRYTVRNDDPEAVRQRTGEAQAIRDYILKGYPPEFDYKYLIVGDVNDTRASAPIRRLLKRGDRIISEMVMAADSRGHRWTHHYAKEDDYSRVDYLLASPAMLQHIVEESGTVFDGPEMEKGSDHRMVYVDLVF